VAFGAIPPGYQNQPLQGCLLYSLHVLFCCVWAVTFVGTLMGRVAPGFAGYQAQHLLALIPPKPPFRCGRVGAALNGGHRS